MKFDAPIITRNPKDASSISKDIEDFGYDGLFTFEGPHDPFLPLSIAAFNTKKIQLITSIAVAFARNPMILANIAYDLQLLSEGRFILGLGSQIKPHIERRFSMPWSSPAKRMKEMVLAIKAIWEAWENGTKLDFKGEFYNHTLMTPFFNPGKADFGLPKIYLAGVGPVMTQVAGEVADGLMVHPFHTAQSMKNITLPSVKKGNLNSLNDGFEISVGVMLASSDDQDSLDQAINGLRSQIAFYGSTPAYKIVLEQHGWEHIHVELNRLSKKGSWNDMPTLISDEILETVGVVGNAEEVTKTLQNRYKEFADRIAPTFFNTDLEHQSKILKLLKKA